MQIRTEEFGDKIATRISMSRGNNSAQTNMSSKGEMKMSLSEMTCMGSALVQDRAPSNPKTDILMFKMLQQFQFTVCSLR